MNDSGCQFSWQQFWAYYISPNYSDDLRVETLISLDLAGCITGAMTPVQIEILEFAPKELVLLPEVMNNLTSSSKEKLIGKCEPEIMTEEQIKDLTRKILGR